MLAIDVSVQTSLISLATVVVTTIGAIIIAKANKIHTLTNSSLLASNQRLDIALAKINDLQSMINVLQTASANAATAAAAAAMPPGAPNPPSEPPKGSQ